MNQVFFFSPQNYLYKPVQIKKWNCALENQFKELYLKNFNGSFSYYPQNPLFQISVFIIFPFHIIDE